MKLEPSNRRKVMDTEQKVAQVDHVINVAHHTHQESVQHLARNVINVDLKTISVAVVGQRTGAKEMAMVEDHPKLKAQRDVTDTEGEADAPDPDQDPTVD